jgi:hypothetical protein
MIYWSIVEFHNGQFNSVQGPYMDQMEAFDHIDKLKANRKRRPVPIQITWQAVKILHPSYVG